MYVIDLFTPDEVAALRREILQIPFVNGNETVSGHARLLKNNQQLPIGDPRTDQVVAKLHAHLMANETFRAVTFPKQIVSMLVNRYDVGETYGWHTDRTLMGTPPNTARGDMSFTIFLTDPQEYEGGELALDMGGPMVRLKMPAGRMVVYNTQHIHQVEPVTRGSRLCCVGWVESWISNPLGRETLVRLGELWSDVGEGQSVEAKNKFAYVYQNLIRVLSN